MCKLHLQKITEFDFLENRKIATLLKALYPPVNLYTNSPESHRVYLGLQDPDLFSEAFQICFYLLWSLIATQFFPVNLETVIKLRES